MSDDLWGGDAGAMTGQRQVMRKPNGQLLPGYTANPNGRRPGTVTKRKKLLSEMALRDVAKIYRELWKDVLGERPDRPGVYAPPHPFVRTAALGRLTALARLAEQRVLAVQPPEAGQQSEWTGHLNPDEYEQLLGLLDAAEARMREPRAMARAMKSLPAPADNFDISFEEDDR